MSKAKYSPKEVNTVTNVGNVVDFVYFQVTLYLYAVT